MALVLKKKICLTTPQGVSEVQLLFGDITQLPVDEKVDAIFVSAFPGTYTAVPSSLIGALQRNLGIIVKELAKDKDIDLRQNFNCWVSKPLPEESPFRRLVCFERMNRSEKLPEQINGMYRAMMPVFNNQDTSVITPLLASGKQGHSQEAALESIVRAACHWIKAGLPLRCLKVVVYQPNPHAATSADTKLVQQFLRYKRKWESKTEQRVDHFKKKYDVCLSYSREDEGLVSKICSSLHNVHAQIVIHREQLTHNDEQVWQKEIFDIMVRSRKIIAVLTPNYLDKPECLEQFNLALCCNRLTKAEVLAPFYMQTVDVFPSYMTLIQYTECRVRKAGEVAEQLLATACLMLVKDLDRNLQQQQEQAEQSGPQTREGGAEEVVEDGAYDIFISYAHRSPVEATQLYETLLDKDPNLKIFLDRSELKTGNIWQETLYEAVDNAKLVAAFISKSYLKSTICQEEYNIALARFLSEDGSFLVPLLMDSDITEVPVVFASAPVVDIRDPTNRYSNMYHSIAEALITLLRTADQQNRFRRPSEKADISSVTDQWRRHDFHQRFRLDSNGTIGPTPEAQTQQADNTTSVKPQTVVISFSQGCLHHASILSMLLRHQKSVNIMVEFLASQQSSGAGAPKLQLLDSADMVVVMMSDDYLESAQHRNELHIALCRQRMTKDRQVLYLVQDHHSKPKPVYAHLLPHSINLRDKHWFTLARETSKLESTESFLVQLPDGMEMQVKCSGLEYLALMTAAVDVAGKLAAGGASGDSGIATNIVNLANLMCLGEPGTVPLKKCLLPLSALTGNMTESPKETSRQEYNTRMFEDAKRYAELVDQLTMEMETPPKQKSSTCQLL